MKQSTADVAVSAKNPFQYTLSSQNPKQPEPCPKLGLTTITVYNIVLTPNPNNNTPHPLTLRTQTPVYKHKWPAPESQDTYK